MTQIVLNFDLMCNLVHESLICLHWTFLYSSEIKLNMYRKSKYHIKQIKKSKD